MYVSEFKHKGVLVGLHNDHLSDIYAEASLIGNKMQTVMDWYLSMVMKS